MSDSVQLRPIQKEDLPVLFEQQRDPEAVYMAAFTAKDPEDREAFDAHWAKIIDNETVVIRAILCNGTIAGSVLSYVLEDSPEVSYWIGKSFWGRGVATAALKMFLTLESARPIYARAAKDNIGSIRVLEKCGFTPLNETRGFAQARGAQIEEVVCILT
jgi:RimJ/RimL family protein N-acetyltransferase